MTLFLLAFIAASVASLLLSRPVTAAPYHIHNLKADPLLGSTNSRQELQARMQLYDARARTAAQDLGLTTAEFQTLRTRLASAPYVIIPRRLNAMTGYAHGAPYVLHDVVIPANSRGWEVDLVNGDKITQVFIPAACGNLSILRRFQPHVALVSARHTRRVATPAPVPTAVAVIPVTPSATPVPVSEALPISVPAPSLKISAPQAPAHRGRFPWWLALIVIPFIHGGSSSQAPAFHTPPMPPPTPVVCKP